MCMCECEFVPSVCVCVCVPPVLLSLPPPPHPPPPPPPTDGLMVQITVETMADLRRALREMKDYTVTCGRQDQSDSQEHVRVDWLEEKSVVNKG